MILIIDKIKELILMKLYIRRYSDYRTGTELVVDDIEDLMAEYNNSDNSESNESNIDAENADIMIQEDETLFEIIEMNTSTNNNKFFIYLITGEGCYDGYDVFHIKRVSKQKIANKILGQLYSDINGFQPFVVEGLTSSYKEKGYYPDPLPFMDGQSLIDENLIGKIQNNYYCLAIIIKNNQLIKYKQIKPVF